MLIQKCFSLVPGEDKNLENLVNELAQSKKNIRKIQNYGAKERSADSSIHKDVVNEKVEKLTIPSVSSRRNANTSEKDRWCSFKQKKNNAGKDSPTLSQKYKKTTFDISEDIKAIGRDPPTRAKFDLSNIKENELFQRIFKTVERENLKCKNEKLKRKSEKLKHLKNNLENQNEHVKSKNVKEENKDQPTDLISEFRKVLSDKKKTYTTLKIRTRSFQKEHASFSPFPDNDVECYNIHYNCKGGSFKNRSWGEVYEKTEQRQKRKEHTKMQRMELPYQNGQDRIAKGTAHRSSHKQKGCTSSKVNQNDLINAEQGNTTHYFTKRSNVPPQKEHRSENTYRQFESPSVMEEETPLKGRRLPPQWEEKSSRSNSRGNKSQCQYYIRSCSSNISVPSSNNYKKCKNSLSAAKQKDKMCEQINDDKKGNRGRKDNNGKKKEKKKFANTRDNKLCNHKNKRSHTCGHIFRNTYTTHRRASKYKLLHRRLHLINDPMDGLHFPKWDNSCGNKFQYLVVKKKRKKINMTIFARTKIEKNMHATNGRIYTLEEESPKSRSEYANSVKEHCHSYSPIRSIEHTRENSNDCQGDQFYQDMATSFKNELKNYQGNSNNEDEKNSNHFKENNKCGASEEGLHKMSDYRIFPHNNSDTHRDRLSKNGKEDEQMHEMKAEVGALKGEGKAQGTCVDPNRWKDTGESNIKIRDRRIEKERTSFNCEPKEEVNLNNSNGEIADLLSHATANAIKRSNTTSITPWERALGGDFDESTDKLRRGNTSIKGLNRVAERGTDDLWKDAISVKLNKELSELAHEGQNIELGKQRKEGNANCISTDLRVDTHGNVHTDQQSINQGKKHILQEILTFYTGYKNKLNFLLQEEYNYLCSLRDYVRKNAQKSEEVKKGNSAEGTSTPDCCEGDNVLISELVHQINNFISEKNKLHHSCDEKDVPTNQVKKCDCRKGKENFIYYLYKDDADVHQICIQTDKRIERIEHYLNQREKKCLGENKSITKREASPFAKSSSSDRSSNKSEHFCKDSSVENNQPHCPFRRTDMTNLRNSEEEMNYIRIGKRTPLSWRPSTMTKRTLKETSIRAAMNKKVLVRKKGSFKKGHRSKENFKYELLFRIKVSKYFLHNWKKLGGHYSASSNYLLRGLKCAAAKGFHLCDKSELHFKGSLSLFNYKPCLHHFKANTFYCYMLCAKKRGIFRKRLSNAPNRARDPNYQHAQKVDRRECSNYLNCADEHTVGKNNRTYQNVPKDRENEETKIFTMPTPICEHNFHVKRTNSNFRHISCSPVYAGESLPNAHFTNNVMKHANNSIPCSGGKYITKEESDSFCSTNLRWNQKSTPDLCGTMWRGKRNTEGPTCESSTHRVANSKWVTSTSTYITQTGGKNNPLKNDTPTSSSLHQGNINLNTSDAYHVSPNLLRDKDKREQLYDNSAEGKDSMQSANSIKSLGIKKGSPINGEHICEQNYPFEKHPTRISHHIGASKKENFASSNENNYLTNSITVEQTNAHFNVNDKCTTGGEYAEWLSFPNGGRTTEYPPGSECYINVYENNYDKNDSLGKSKNMYQLNYSYDKIVNSLCISRGKIAQENVRTNNNCKKEEKCKKQSNVINDEGGQNGKDNLPNIWVDNFNQVREYNRDSNTPSRKNNKCQVVPQEGNIIPRDKFNVNKSNSSATAAAVDKYYVDLLTNGDIHSRHNIGAKLKKKKKKANNIPHDERGENKNTPIQNVHLFEKEKKKGNSPEKELIQCETHATQMHHIGRDRKGVGTTIYSLPNDQQNGQLSPPVNATNCIYRENHDLDKHINFEKRESYNFFDDAVDTFDRDMREENSILFNTHRGISQNEIKVKWEEIKRRDYNPEECSNFTNSLNGRREENYFFPSSNEKHNLRKLKYDLSEHLYGDTPLNWNPSSSTPQKGTIHAEEYTAQKGDSPHTVQHGTGGNVLTREDNTVNTEYREKINDHFNQSHFSDFYNSNSFSQNSNFTDQDWGIKGNSNSGSISHNFTNTNKLDQIIEKIKKWNEHISNDVNYIQCLFCDKYLFKVENHHDRDVLNSSMNESIRREKYTCSICKHKIKTLSKYNDEVKIGEQVVDIQKGGYFEGKLKDGKKCMPYNAESVVDFLKTENFENSLDITYSGSNKIASSMRTDAPLNGASLKDASLNSDVLKKGAYHKGRKSESGNVLGEKCRIDDLPQFAKYSSEKEALSLHNRNLNYPRGFAIFDDTPGNGPHGSNIDSGLFRFEEDHPKSLSDRDSKSTRSSGSRSDENVVHTHSLDNEMRTQEWGKFDQMNATEGRQFEHTHDGDDNDADAAMMSKTSRVKQNEVELRIKRDKTDDENVGKKKKKKRTFAGEAIHK
ncbi:Uncharacterized protein PCOAH_00046910 [Plasmodium coatneyi]|uniref:Uncharacterized protein n=1 Tax=Plasmodium coatneyi TaxID=208452 RepID=A0A1B1E328_9APIC|nr:Uncharacterized protein PCOAH_00046910 [Plasmodium coatneyi]ANQ09421.1 Uncharacterized protein PCOAH_00046910 [Plasmodium coatneyi]